MTPTLQAPPPTRLTMERGRPAGPAARRRPGTVAALASALAGGIHLGAAPSHLASWPLESAAFVIVGVLQVVLGATWSSTRDRRVARALAAVHLAATTTWVLVRTIGWPFGPFAGEVEPVAAADATAAVAAIVAVLALRLSGTGRLPRTSRRAVAAGGAVLVLVTAPAVALVPGLTHDPSDHGHGFELAPDQRADGLDLRRRADQPTDGVPVAVGDAPVDVVLGHGLLWVADGGGGTITRLGPDGEVVDVLTGVGVGPTAVATGPDAVWVAAADGTVTRLDPTTGRATGQVRVGRLAKGLAVGGDGTVFVASAADGQLHRLDPVTLAVTSAPLQPGVLAAFDGTGPSALAVDTGATDAPDDDLVWAVLTLKREVRRYDAVTLAPVGQPIATGAGATDLVLTDELAWIANTTAGTLTRVDRTTGAPVGDPILVDSQPQVGGGPAALTLAFGSLWVVNNDERTVTRVDPATGAVLGAPLFLANHHAEVPRAVGIVGGPDAVWVTDYDGDRVVRLAPVG